MAIPLRIGNSTPGKFSAKTNRKTQDPRLWLGISFILIAMVLGQIVISKASARVTAVTLTTDIAKGSLIRDTDVSAALVSVPSMNNVIELPSDVIGKVAATDLYAGDLVSTHSVTNNFATAARVVSIPIRAGHLPQVSSGGKVDIWMTPSLDGVAIPGPAAQIIERAVIYDAPDFVDAGLDTSVTVLISEEQVQVLVQAMRDGVIDLVVHPDGSDEK